MDIISQLPKDCLTQIISLTSPRDACRSSLVSPIFRSASDSDSVWDNFLPFDYAQFPQFLDLNGFSKKQIYLHICDNPVVVADDNKSFSLDKPTGKKCVMVGARGLSITWGDTPEYWEWKSLPESRFSQVAKLRLVWWLQVSANLETRILSPRTTYEAFFVFKLSRPLYNFNNTPVQLHVQFDGREIGDAISVFLGSSSNTGPPRPRDRVDGWKEIKMGEFIIEDGDDGSVSCHMKEVTCNHVWSGLIVEGVELRPKPE